MDIGSIVITAVLAGGGAYLGSYLKKKGENWATQEDIDKLVKQVAIVTQTTKEIEAKITNEVWERQRKWDLKREALFEAMKELATVLYTIGRLEAAYRIRNKYAPDSIEQLNTAT